MIATMALNPVIFSCKSPVFFQLLGKHANSTFYRPNVTKIKVPDSLTNTAFDSISSCAFQCNRRKILSRQLGDFGNATRISSMVTAWRAAFRSILSTEGQAPTNYSRLKISGLNKFLVESTGGGSGGSGGDGGSDSGGSGNGGGGGGGGGGGDKWSFLSWYLSLLEAHPVWTKAVTSALLTFVGDLICQVMIDQVSFPDLKRLSLFTFLGMVLVGPTLHFWYLYLSKLVTTTGASGAFLRLIIDQFVFAPAFIGVFLSTLVTLEGRPSQVLPKLQQEWLSSVIANWQLWIPFQFLNFRFVPQQFQVLAANFIALVWNVILSYKAHKEVVAK